MDNIAEAVKPEVNEDILKNVKLNEDTLKLLEEKPDLKDATAHLVEAKRQANAEAKALREQLEALQAEKELAEKQRLEKKGEFEKLYQDANEKLIQKDAKIKEALIRGELSRLAGLNGLAKQEYLRLLDTSSIEVDVDSATVKGAEETFEKFKTENPELFRQAVVSTDSAQPQLKPNNLSDMERLKQLEETARKTGLPRDLSAFSNLKKELKLAGKI